MCNPALIVMAVMAAAKTAMQIKASNDEANAHNKQQDKFYKDTAHAAAEDTRNQYASVGNRQVQEAAAAALATNKASKESQAASASAMAAAAEGGVTGLSIDSLANDFQRSYLGVADTNAQNLDFFNLQAEDEKRGIESQGKSRVMQATPNYMGKTTGLAAMLKIGMAAGGSAASGYASGAGGDGAKAPTTAPSYQSPNYKPPGIR